jgi:hypothetical protein
MMQPSSKTLATARSLLAEHGELRPQSAYDWRGSFPLPSDLSTFYDVVGPVNVRIVSYGNPYHFPSLSNLWDFQAGYRWNGLTGKPIADWHDDWLVVADQGGDAFIFDRSTSKILFALHGQGAWEPEEWFPNVGAMACSLAILGSVVRAAGKDFTDKDSYVKPEHKQSAVARLAEVLGSRSKAEAIVVGAGWG